MTEPLSRRLPTVRGTWFVGAALAVLFVMFLGYPVIGMVVRLFYHDGAFDFSAFEQAWNEPGLGQVLLNTAILVVASGALAISAAVVLAWLNERTDARIPRLGGILALAPLMVPPIAGVVGWVFLFSPVAGFANAEIRSFLGLFGVEMTEGPINVFSWPGMIAISAVYLMPFAYLPISVALRNVDPALEEASTIAGASTFRTVRKVTIPAIAPAVASAFVLVAITGLALYSIPGVLGPDSGIEVLSARIVRLLTYSYPPHTGAAVVLGMLVFVVVALGAFLQNRLLRRGNFAMVGGKASANSLVKLGRWKWLARVVMVGYILCISVFPLIALVIVSVQPFWTPNINLDVLTLDSFSTVLTESAVFREALVRSVVLAVLAATILVGVSIAMSLYSRVAGSRANRLVAAAAALPGSLSHIIVAVAFIVAFAGPPFNLGGTSQILLMVYLAIYVPQAYVAVSSAIGQVGQDLMDASSISGAGIGTTVRRVIMPLGIGGFVAGWTLVVGLVLADVTASVLLSTARNATIGYQVLDLFHNGSYGVMAALAVLVTICAAVVFAGGSLFNRLSRGHGAGRG